MAKETKSSQPKEAEVMAYILKEMGISEYEPGVINQMLEFTYRYVTQILDEARAYANYAKKSKTIEIDDVKLAIHMQVEKSVTTPPPRDLLLELSRTRNANPLPTIKPQCGIRLPPDRYCLSACNMQLKSSFRKSKGGNASGSSRGNIMGSGAKSGNNPLKPSISMMTTKTGNSQTVTLVQKSSSTVSASPSPKVVSVNRPLIKVTPGPPGVGSPKIHISAGSNIGGLKVGGIKTEDLSSKRKRDEDDDDYDV